MPEDNYTAFDLECLQEAIASGEFSVTHNGRKVVYRTLEEMLNLEQKIKQSLAEQANPPVRPRKVFSLCVSSGL